MPLESLLPLFVYFAAGIALRLTGVLRTDQAGVLLRIVFHITLPALAFLAISQAALTGESFLLPVAGFLVNLCCMGLAWGYARLRGVDAHSTGILVIAAGITNMIFIFPFVFATLGPAALADAILYDLGNAVFVASVANSVAIRIGHAKSLRLLDSALRLFRTPLFLALVLAIVVNVGGLRMPPVLVDTLTPLGAATVPLTIISLGLSFEAARLFDSLTLRAMLFRMLPGLLLGMAIARAVGLPEPTATVVVVSSAAPVGFMAVTLAAVARLKTEPAAAAISLSVTIGMLTTSALLSLSWAVS